MRLGWMHAVTANGRLIPFGECLYLWTSLNEYRRGRLENMRIWESKDPRVGDIYRDRLIFSKQVELAKGEGVRFLLVNVEDHDNKVSGTRAMVKDLSSYLYGVLPGVEIVITGPNEPMENIKLAGTISFTNEIITGVKDAGLQGKVKVSAGNESIAFRDFWEGLIDHFGNTINYYDFHTSNSGSYDDLDWILRNAPAPLINSEHFLWDLGWAKGMDHPDTYTRYVEWLRRMKASGKVKAVFCQFPSLYVNSRVFKGIALRLHDSNLNIVHVSQTYREIEKWYQENKEIEEDEDMKLLIYKIGSRGIVVEFLQKCLANSGYYEIHEIDSIFGPKTEKAIREFQESWLGPEEADGIAGRKTMVALLGADPQNLVYWALLQAKYAYGER